jgi:hypothetical protein
MNAYNRVYVYLIECILQENKTRTKKIDPVYVNILKKIDCKLEQNGNKTDTANRNKTATNQEQNGNKTRKPAI